jgi:hypothetical protein
VSFVICIVGMGCAYPEFSNAENGHSVPFAQSPSLAREHPAVASAPSERHQEGGSWRTERAG